MTAGKETALRHPTHLPFTEAQVLARFATVRGGGEPAARLDHYRHELAAYEAAEALARIPRQRTPRPERSIERDERFWTTTALMNLLEGPSPVEDLVALLTRAYGPVAPFAGFATWADALGPAPELYLEAHLPSPASYQQHLPGELRRHAACTTRPETLEKHLPHRPGAVVRAAASRLGWATWEDVERVRPGCLPWRAVPGAR